MDVRLSTEGVLNLACAALVASAIGFSALGSSTSGCAAPRLVKGDAAVDTDDWRSCDAIELSETDRGRPGMRFVIN